MDDLYYVVEIKWYNHLLEFLQGRAENPGDCDNSALVNKKFEKENFKFYEMKKVNCADGEQFVLIPSDSMDTLIHLKFIINPLIQRKVMKDSPTSPAKVSYHPTYLQVALYSSKSGEEPLKFSDDIFPKWTIKYFKTKLRERFNAKNKKAKIWTAFKGNPVKKVRSAEERDVDDEFQNGDQVILEVAEATGTFSIQESEEKSTISATTSRFSSSSTSTYSYRSSYLRSEQRGHGSGGKAGIAGLNNLGKFVFFFFK